MRPDPMSSEKWHAIALEAKLTRQLCGAGLTAISRANYADGMGEYYIAFFSLSIGIERLAKLILCVDHCKNNSGVFPTDKDMRNYGHKIENLTDKVIKIQRAHEIKLSYGELNDPISQKIIQCIDAFADAKKGRYANFGALVDPNFDINHEPIKLWNDSVAQAILNKHFRDKRIEKKAKRNAEVVEAMMGGNISVNYTSEDGAPLNSLQSALFRTGENKVMQKYGRYYSFLIVRYLSEVFTSMTHTYGYSDDESLWFGHYEHFKTFNVPNEFGLNRKIWPLS